MGGGSPAKKMTTNAAKSAQASETEIKETATRKEKPRKVTMGRVDQKAKMAKKVCGWKSGSSFFGFVERRTHTAATGLA